MATIRTTRTAAPGGSLGVVTGSALTLGSVVGTGVLTLPGLAVRTAGPAALVAVAALVLLSISLAATFAALGARLPGAGGVSSFVHRGLGPTAATVTAWWFYLGVPLGVPALGLFAGDHVEAAVGGGTLTRIGTALALVLAAAVANARGVRVSGPVQVVLTGVLVLGLLTVLAVCLPAADLDRLTPVAPHGWAAVAPALLVLVWMLTGWEAVTHVTGRFRRPGRDVPRATAVTLLVVAVLFVGTTFALATAPPDVAASDAPVTALLALRLGPPAAVVLAVLAVLVTVGNNTAYLAGLAELGSEMGRSGQAPRWLAGTGPSALPARSLAVVTGQALVSLLVATVLGWPTEHLVLVTAASQVAVFAAGLLAALRLLPRRSPGWWSALASLPPVLVLAVLSGGYLLVPVALAVAALAYHRTRDRRTPSAGESAADDVGALDVVQRRVPALSGPGRAGPRGPAPTPGRARSRR